MSESLWLHRASNFGAMRPISRVLTLLLLAAAATASLAAQVLSPPAVTHERHAACHEHGQKAPTREPISYRCCQAGHSAAILQESFKPQASVLHVSPVVELTKPLIAEPSPNALQDLVIPSSAPPNAAVLRI